MALSPTNKYMFTKLGIFYVHLFYGEHDIIVTMADGLVCESVCPRCNLALDRGILKLLGTNVCLSETVLRALTMSIA